ncbi:MAG: hypothetical protein NTW28_14325, partial [Candidatus Solibacter sp.]|nr:hypothetical protein [Candidatus Solibacter sp.]
PAGRAYTIGEYNQPWPNTNAAEIDPALAAFAAFQDWDGLIHFSYSAGRNWDAPPRDTTSFDLLADVQKVVNFGQAAWLFRTGAIRGGRAPVEVPVSDAMKLRFVREKRIAEPGSGVPDPPNGAPVAWVGILETGNVAAFLQSAAGYDPAMALVHPVRVALSEKPWRALPAVKSPYRSDTGEMTYDRERKLLLLHAPGVAGVFGFAGTSRATAGPLSVELTPGGRGNVALLLTTLDGQPLGRSRRLLLSTSGDVRHTEPGSNPPHPLGGMVPHGGSPDWWALPPPAVGTSGQWPVWMERVEANVTLKTEARRIAVYPLDGRGRRMQPLPARSIARLRGGFRIHLQAAGDQFSPWYEIAMNE